MGLRWVERLTVRGGEKVSGKKQMAVVGVYGLVFKVPAKGYCGALDWSTHV